VVIVLKQIQYLRISMHVMQKVRVLLLKVVQWRKFIFTL
jgi:hypothetical protein